MTFSRRVHSLCEARVMFLDLGQEQVWPVGIVAYKCKNICWKRLGITARRRFWRQYFPILRFAIRISQRSVDLLAFSVETNALCNLEGMLRNSHAQESTESFVQALPTRVGFKVTTFPKMGDRNSSFIQVRCRARTFSAVTDAGRSISENFVMPIEPPNCLVTGNEDIPTWSRPCPRDFARFFFIIHSCLATTRKYGLATNNATVTVRHA